MCFIWICSISGIFSLLFSYNSRSLAQETVGIYSEGITRDEMKAYDLIKMASHTFFLFSLLTLVVGVLGVFCPRFYKPAACI